MTEIFNAQTAENCRGLYLLQSGVVEVTTLIIPFPSQARGSHFVMSPVPEKGAPLSSIPNGGEGRGEEVNDPGAAITADLK
jgi:hypothetical protein